MEEPVRLDIEDGAAVLTLSNPDGGNRLGLETCRALDALTGELTGRGIRALLIRAEGRQFCVGGAIGEFSGTGDVAGYLADLLPVGHRAVRRLANLDYPVIAAIQGPVAGAGIALALCADIVIAGRSAALRAGYPALGLSSDFGVSWFLARLAGSRLAADVLLNNRLLSAEEMVSFGLASRLCDDADLDAESRAMLTRLAKGPTAALGRLKRLVAGAGAHDLSRSLDEEARLMIECGGTRDAGEGVAAFLERRPPVFSGR